MNAMQRIAEARIADAIERGVFENLPGAGRPLELEDLSGVPEDLRASYLLLKGAGYVPEEIRLKKECLHLQDLIDACHDDVEIARLRERRSVLLLRFELLMQERRTRARSAGYAAQLAARLGA